MAKRGEYADAAIPHYWIVDIEPPISLLFCHLAGELGYQESGETTERSSQPSPSPPAFSSTSWCADPDPPYGRVCSGVDGA